jgi:hypothetical protein
MRSDLQIINPLEYPQWDNFLLSQKEYSFFHSSHWARVLHESYGYRPLYFMRNDGGALTILFPLMEVKSLLTGSRAVALPFTDYCEPILSDKKKFPETLDQMIWYGRKAGWKSIEIRAKSEVSSEIPSSSLFYVHTCALSLALAGISESFRDSTRRNVKKADREGVTVSFSSSADSVEEFYRLNCVTRREHGLPPQPYYFFKKIFEHIISKGLGLVGLANYEDRNIAGAIYLHSRDEVIYKYGASLKKYQHLRANNLVMWEALNRYSKNGYKKLSLGITALENAGLKQFKSGWGAEEQIIKYIRYDLKAKSFISTKSHLTGGHNTIFRHMPIPLLKAAGYLLYRHMG